MREYTGKNEKSLKRVVCNCCGKELSVRMGILQEGAAHLQQTWGYFSEKDGMTDSFDLCEDCYDKMIESFFIPITRKEKTELI